MQAISARVFIAVKRHHDHSNSEKGKHLFGTGLQSEVQSIIIKSRTWQHLGRHGKGPESSTFYFILFYFFFLSEYTILFNIQTSLRHVQYGNFTGGLTLPRMIAC